MDVNFNSSDIVHSDIKNADVAKKSASVSKNNQTSFLADRKSTVSENKSFDIFSKSFADLERDLKLFEFSGFELTSDEKLSDALENEKVMLLKEQQEAINKEDNTQLNFFELAVKSIEKLTGKSVVSIQND